MSKYVIGIDEVGWGCVAGPIVVCAAMVPFGKWEKLRAQGFRDSKKVGNRLKVSADPRTRVTDGKCSQLADFLEANHGWATWALAQADPIEIDSSGNPAAVKDRICWVAVRRLMHANGWQDHEVEVIMDGNQLVSTIPKTIEQTCMPKADDLVMPVSVASILAKSSRDRQVLAIAPRYPAYGFETHKGYPTEAHQAAVLQLGPIAGVHRSYYLRNMFRRAHKAGKIPHPPRWLRDSGWLES